MANIWTDKAKSWAATRAGGQSPVGKPHVNGVRAAKPWMCSKGEVLVTDEVCVLSPKQMWGKASSHSSY